MRKYLSSVLMALAMCLSTGFAYAQPPTQQLPTFQSPAWAKADAKPTIVATSQSKLQAQAIAPAQALPTAEAMKTGLVRITPKSTTQPAQTQSEVTKVSGKIDSSTPTYI